MTWWLAHNYEQKLPYLKARMELTRAVRRFFDTQNFWEVETPILQVTPVMDMHIHGFKTDMKDINLNYERDLYLHTSPEFAMKKMMVAGMEKLYQICHVFRNGEGGRLHSAEFTMIEWYRTNAGYRDIMADCEGLLKACAKDLGISHYRHKDIECDPFGAWDYISVAGAFIKYADINLDDHLEDRDSFMMALKDKGIRTADDDAWDDLFFRVMAEYIEPHLGMKTPCILYDYPVSMAALSRKKQEDARYAERFELYVCGIELANAFGELTDAVEQRTRFVEEMKAKKERYGESYPLDEDFLKALEHGMPESGGIAFGIDRLAMVASGADDIDQVLWAGKP